MATLRVEDAPLLDAIAEASLPSKCLDAQGLASIAWSFASLEFRHGPWLDAMAAHASEHLTEYNAQDLSNTAWAFATLEVVNSPLLTAIAAQARARLLSFQTKEIDMTIWAISLLDDFEHCWELAALADRRGLLGSLGVSALLAQCEWRGLPLRRSQLLWRSAVERELPAAAIAAVIGMADAGDAEGALALLKRATCFNLCESKFSRRFHAACAVEWGDCVEASDEQSATHSLAAPRSSTTRSKVANVLPYVFATATPGDPHAACKALERYASEVLPHGRQWLKIAGGEKAAVVAEALQVMPDDGVILEIGTYVGYSAMRIAALYPGRRVVSLEVEPLHAAVAEALSVHAGVAHNIDIWVGHSKEVLPRLPLLYKKASQTARTGRLQVAAVFMDQCGSRFWEDLDILIGMNLLAPGAVIVADNVLKPGAPKYLCHVAGGREDFQTVIRSVTEFAMPGVEDWVSVTRWWPSHACDRDPPPLPREVAALEWEAQQMRVKAARATGGVDFEEWASFASWMRQQLAGLGIVADRPEIH